MAIRADEISQILKQQIQDYEGRVSVSETGTILSVGDGIARIYGLENAMAGELLEFPGGMMGMVLNLEEDNVGVVLFGEDLGGGHEGALVPALDGGEQRADRHHRLAATDVALQQPVHRHGRHQIGGDLLELLPHLSLADDQQL